MYRTTTCPLVRQVIPLRSQWGYPLLVELSKHPSSFSTLKQALSPITSKTLSTCLKKARDSHCLTRKNEYYLLTTQGEQLLLTLKNILIPSSACEDCSGKPLCPLK